MKCTACGTELWNRRHYGREYPMEAGVPIKPGGALMPGEMHTPDRCQQLTGKPYLSAKAEAALKLIVDAARNSRNCIQCAPEEQDDAALLTAIELVQSWLPSEPDREHQR